MTEHKIEDLIVVSKKDIEDSIKELRKSQIDSLANSINSNIANHLVELIANSAPLEPIVEDAFDGGYNHKFSVVHKNKTEYLSNTKISIP